MKTRKTLTLKQISRENGDVRRLLAALERGRGAGTSEGFGPEAWLRQFTTAAKAAGKPPP